MAERRTTATTRRMPPKCGKARTSVWNVHLRSSAQAKLQRALDERAVLEAKLEEPEGKQPPDAERVAAQRTAATSALVGGAPELDIPVVTSRSDVSPDEEDRPTRKGLEKGLAFPRGPRAGEDSGAARLQVSPSGPS